MDGDTLNVRGMPVRLFGIDAPESRQTCEVRNRTYPCGKQATAELAKLVASGSVSCKIVGKDDFGRSLGICSSGERELNASMVDEGWALAFRKYSHRYEANEEAAATAKVGMWSGLFVRPDEWRMREVEATLSTRECVIKGNISSGGDRIYHLPFQEFYSRTKISEDKGERWFCSEAEALEAGWRRSLR